MTKETLIQAKMKQRNCKNCGAPIEHSYNHQCPYCKTLFDFNQPQEETIEVHSWDMINLILREIERDPFSCCIRIIFEGYKLDTPKIYEYDGKDTFVSETVNYINPPKSFFFINIPINDLQKYGFEYLEYVIRNNIRPSEYENVSRQLKEHIHEISVYAH